MDTIVVFRPPGFGVQVLISWLEHYSGNIFRIIFVFFVLHFSVRFRRLSFWVHNLLPAFRALVREIFIMCILLFRYSIKVNFSVLHVLCLLRFFVELPSFSARDIVSQSFEVFFNAVNTCHIYPIQSIPINLWFWKQQRTSAVHTYQPARFLRTLCRSSHYSWSIHNIHFTLLTSNSKRISRHGTNSRKHSLVRSLESWQIDSSPQFGNHFDRLNANTLRHIFEELSRKVDGPFENRVNIGLALQREWCRAGDRCTIN